MSNMLPEDMAALLSQGGDPAAAMGGGAPPMGDPMGGGGGLPPDMAALMQSELPAEGEAPPSVMEGEAGGGEEALTVAIDAIQDAIDAEADQEDIQVMLQCQAKLQSILAKNQKEADSALGGSASPRAIRRMSGGLGG